MTPKLLRPSPVLVSVLDLIDWYHAISNVYIESKVFSNYSRHQFSNSFFFSCITALASNTAAYWLQIGNSYSAFPQKAISHHSFNHSIPPWNLQPASFDFLSVRRRINITPVFRGFSLCRPISLWNSLPPHLRSILILTLISRSI